MTIKELYYDIAKAIKGICDKTYYQDRPTSVEDRPDSYIVISLYRLYNNEIGQSGEYNDFEGTVQIEVYVRDRASAGNPNAVNLALMSEKVTKVMSLFPIRGDHSTATKPSVTLQDSDGDGFHVTIIQARLRTR